MLKFLTDANRGAKKVFLYGHGGGGGGTKSCFYTAFIHTPLPPPHPAPLINNEHSLSRSNLPFVTVL